MRLLLILLMVPVVSLDLMLCSVANAEESVEHLERERDALRKQIRELEHTRKQLSLKRIEITKRIRKLRQVAIPLESIRKIDNGKLNEALLTSGISQAVVVKGTGEEALKNVITALGKKQNRWSHTFEDGTELTLFWYVRPTKDFRVELDSVIKDGGESMEGFAKLVGAITVNYKIIREVGRTPVGYYVLIPLGKLSKGQYVVTGKSVGHQFRIRTVCDMSIFQIEE